MAIDEQLVLRFRKGDREAFADLVTQYRNYIASITYSATGDFGRSEEIAQQAFVVAWQSREKLQEPNKWLAWMSGITRNLLREDYRRRAKPLEAKSVSLESAHEPQTLEASPEKKAIDAEQAELLWSVLEDVPVNYREPLVLFYREGKSINAVASLLDLSADTVKQRLSRGRKMLKTEVSKFVEDTLFDTRPDSRFSAAVLAALPAATVATSAKAGGSILGSLVALKFLGFLIGPLIGVAGAIFGSKRSLDSATSETERSYIWKMIVASSLLVVVLLGTMFGIRMVSQELFEHPLTQISIWGIYMVLLVALIVISNRGLSAIKKRHGTPEEKQNLKQATIKPVSTAALRWNMAGMIVGSTIALEVFAFITRDWFMLAMMVLSIAALVIWFWLKAPNYRDVPAQLRYNGIASWAGCTTMSLFAFIRWDYWMERFPIHPQLPGWAIVLFLLAVGLLVAGSLFYKARSLEDSLYREDV